MNNFLQYDLVALDAQYFIRGHVPEWDDKMAEFAELSAQRHNLQNTILDISYGDQPRQKLDVLIPQNVRQNAPVFVFFHGGYWRRRYERHSRGPEGSWLHGFRIGCF